MLVCLQSTSEMFWFPRSSSICSQIICLECGAKMAPKHGTQQQTRSGQDGAEAAKEAQRGRFVSGEDLCRGGA